MVLLLLSAEAAPYTWTMNALTRDLSISIHGTEIGGVMVAHYIKNNKVISKPPSRYAPQSSVGDIVPNHAAKDHVNKCVCPKRRYLIFHQRAAKRLFDGGNAGIPKSEQTIRRIHPG